jgi:2-methylcitrate dehydratase PrpD
MESPGADLAAFAAALRFEHIPARVIDRAEDLLVDWFGSRWQGRAHGR